MTLIRFLFILLLPGICSLSCSWNPPGISITSVSQDGILGTLIQHQTDSPQATIVFLHGSGGPMVPDMLIPLAQRGNSILMLDYFGRSGLPEDLAGIPLEYVEKGINWARQTYPETPVILLGQSRGAELAMIYCCWFDNVDGVIAYSPSGIHITEAVRYQTGDPRRASWTFQGKELPYAEIAALPEEGGTYEYRDWFQPILADSARFFHSRIPIERSQCPILLMSGAEDLIWPSAKMVDRLLSDPDSSLQARMKTIRYPDAGHQFLYFYDKAPLNFSSQQSFWLRGERYRFPFGGTLEGNQQAMIKSRNETMAFIERIVDSSSSIKKSQYLPE